MLSIEGLAVDLGGRRILSGVSLRVADGGFTALLGPNGSGKTTLLRTVYKAVPRAAGRIEVEGRSIDELSPRALAQRLAVMQQEVALEFDFTAREIAAMGRSPYRGLLDPERPEDAAIVDRAMAMADVGQLAPRVFTTLSGGEKQRVLLARALAQQPRVLLLDEPTSHLDLRHQLDLLSRVRGLGITVLAVLHDLNLALQFADQAVLLSGGAVAAAGPVGEVLSEENVGRVFSVGSERLLTRSGRVILGFDSRSPLG
jgi:iron complex transport system ATP-binding protein